MSTDQTSPSMMLSAPFAGRERKWTVLGAALPTTYSSKMCYLTTQQCWPTRNQCLRCGMPRYVTSGQECPPPPWAPPGPPPREQQQDPGRASSPVPRGPPTRRRPNRRPAAPAPVGIQNQSLVSKFNAPVVVPPQLKEDELLVKRKEWDKARSLLDKTVTRMGVVQAEFEKFGLLDIEQLEKEWQEMSSKIQAGAQASAKSNAQLDDDLISDVPRRVMMNPALPRRVMRMGSSRCLAARKGKKRKKGRPHPMV